MRVHDIQRFLRKSGPLKTWKSGERTTPAIPTTTAANEPHEARHAEFKLARHDGRLTHNVRLDDSKNRPPLLLLRRECRHGGAKTGVCILCLVSYPPARSRGKKGGAFYSVLFGSRGWQCWCEYWVVAQGRPSGLSCCRGREPRLDAGDKQPHRVSPFSRRGEVGTHAASGGGCLLCSGWKTWGKIPESCTCAGRGRKDAGMIRRNPQEWIQKKVDWYFFAFIFYF